VERAGPVGCGTRGGGGGAPVGHGGGGGYRVEQIGEWGGARGERGPVGGEGKWARPRKQWNL
jgi:hypothetical protein